eukprot:5706641-Amphidinium_carterae.1
MENTWFAGRRHPHNTPPPKKTKPENAKSNGLDLPLTADPGKPEEHALESPESKSIRYNSGPKTCDATNAPSSQGRLRNPHGQLNGQILPPLCLGIHQPDGKET